ncbi:MBL fold metallo-hydrolase [Halalkalibacter kiskunsagensis]|uniref:MBL fold metallo-hydrolase n=1 Tax=Halalkalibacter kiskunsagensis TaxID=1548599 RepID=A0ABV6KD42_9BACI
MEVCAETIHQLTIPTPFQVGPVHVYLICGEKLTLVDTGPLTKEGEEVLVNSLKKLGYSLKDIEQVILTHHHPDHVGLAGLFTHATIIGHRYLRPWLTKDHSFLKRCIEFFELFYKEHGVPMKVIEKVKYTSEAYISFIEETDLQVLVKHGDDVPGLFGWKVIEVPGHAQNHIMIVRERDKTAIGADVLLASISSNALLEAPMEDEERPKTLLQYRRSLQLLKTLNIIKLYPGHGETIYEVNEIASQRLQGHLERAKVIKALISEKKMSANEISYELFKKKHMLQPDLTFSETFGHLDLLVEQGEVTMKKEGSYFYFTE